MATKKQNRPMKSSVVRPGMKKKAPTKKLKQDITKIPGFKFGRGTE
jgi:hypothetical protein